MHNESLKRERAFETRLMYERSAELNPAVFIWTGRCELSGLSAPQFGPELQEKKMRLVKQSQNNGVQTSKVNLKRSPYH